MDNIQIVFSAYEPQSEEIGGQMNHLNKTFLHITFLMNDNNGDKAVISGQTFNLYSVQTTKCSFSHLTHNVTLKVKQSHH